MEPTTEEILKDMSDFISDMKMKGEFEQWLLTRGHDQKTIDSYNEIIDGL